MKIPQAGTDVRFYAGNRADAYRLAIAASPVAIVEPKQPVSERDLVPAAGARCGGRCTDRYRADRHPARTAGIPGRHGRPPSGLRRCPATPVATTIFTARGQQRRSPGLPQRDKGETVAGRNTPARHPNNVHRIKALTNERECLSFCFVGNAAAHAGSPTPLEALGVPSMYVCICNAVTDSDIRACADTGARTVSDLRARLGVASACCRCARFAQTVLQEHLESQARSGCEAPATS